MHSPRLHICAATSSKVAVLLKEIIRELLWWLSGKESACQCRRRRFDPWVRKILEKEMATHSSILAWRIPAAEEPRRDGTIAHWVAKESDTT